MVKEANKIDSRVKLVSLRRNFGKAAALCAGFDHSHGGILITMDGDLQNDPKDIPMMIEENDEEIIFDTPDIVGGGDIEDGPARKVYVNDVEVVVVNEKFGIRLTDVVSAAERIRKLG